MSQPTHPDLSPPDTLPPMDSPATPPRPLTEAAFDAIMSNPNVIFAIARLATCYAESMHLTTRTNATIRAEDEVLSRVGKAVWICVHDVTTGGARGEAPKAAPAPAVEPAPVQPPKALVVPGSGGAGGPGALRGYPPLPQYAGGGASVVFAIAGIDWSAPHAIDAEPRCEGLALDPDDVCGRGGRWCIEDSPWLSPIGWEGAGGDCGGGA